MNSSNQSRQTTVVVLGSLIVILGLSSLILFFQNRLLRQQSAGIPNTQSPSPTATTDPTTNWKEYISKTGEFSFKYPVNLYSTQTLDKNVIEFFESAEVAQKATDCYENKKGTE